MPADSYIDNVVALASLALDAYRPGRGLYNALQPDDDNQSEGETLLIAIEGGSKDLRSVAAVFDAVQLVFDAAAVAVLYATELPDNTDYERNVTLLRNLASEPAWTLEIEALSGGSFSIKLRALFDTTSGRVNLLAVAGLAAVIFSVLLPPVAMPLLVVTGLGYAEQLVDGALKDLLERHRHRQEQPEPAEPEDRQRRQLREHEKRSRQNTANEHLKTEVKNLRATVADLAQRVVDLEAVNAANVTTARFDVQTERKAA